MRILHTIEKQSEWRWLLCLAVLALFVRVVWAGCMMEREPRFDETEYIGHAIRLAEGKGYVDAAEEKVAFWPSGYPLALSVAYRVAGTSKTTALGLQIVISSLTCLLLYLVGRQTFDLLIARVASLLLALYPNHIFFSTLHLTEPLFALLLLGAFSILLRSLSRGDRSYIAAGVVLGLAALTRPLILLFPLLLPFWYLTQGQRWKKALGISFIVFTASLATVSPWLIRNHQLTGRWTSISTNGGYNFWIGNNPKALGGYAVPDDLEGPLRDGDRYDWHRGYRLGWEAMINEPRAAAMRAPCKLSYLFSLETDGALWNLKGFERSPPLSCTLLLLLLANIAYLGMLGTGLLGLLSCPAGSPTKGWVILLVSYMMLTTIVFVGDPRYHFAIVPFLLLFSSKGMLNDAKTLLISLHQGDVTARKRLVVWALIMSLFLLLMTGNLGLKYLETQLY